jgi:hypothetical protein
MGILQLGQYAGAISAIALLVGMFIKWAILKPIKLYIDQATYPIHPNTNGGRSLSDVAQTANRIESKVHDLDYRLNAIEELVTQPATRAKKQQSVARIT